MVVGWQKFWIKNYLSNSSEFKNVGSKKYKSEKMRTKINLGIKWFWFEKLLDPNIFLKNLGQNNFCYKRKYGTLKTPSRNPPFTLQTCKPVKHMPDIVLILTPWNLVKILSVTAEIYNIFSRNGNCHRDKCCIEKYPCKSCHLF